MNPLFDALLPIASVSTGGIVGLLASRSQMRQEMKDRERERQSKERIEERRLANKKDIVQSELNIQKTYHDRFLGIRIHKIKVGLEYNTKAEALLMSPVNLFKFGIAGLFAYTYCSIWQFNALNHSQIVKTVLPDPNSTKVGILGFDFETVEHVISELNLGGLAATTMAQPALMIITYVVTNLTYKQISQK